MKAGPLLSEKAFILLQCTIIKLLDHKHLLSCSLRANREPVDIDA